MIEPAYRFNYPVARSPELLRPRPAIYTATFCYDLSPLVQLSLQGFRDLRAGGRIEHRAFGFNPIE